MGSKQQQWSDSPQALPRLPHCQGHHQLKCMPGMYFRYGKTTAVYWRDGCNFTEITKSFGYLSEQWSNLECIKKEKRKEKNTVILKTG